MDTSKLETNTQTIERLTRELAEAQARLARYERALKYLAAECEDEVHAKAAKEALKP